MNGVFVNQKQLLPSVPYPVDEGDIIQIGKSKDQPFSYIFQSRLVTKYKDGRLKSKMGSFSCDNSLNPINNSQQISPSKHNVPLSDPQPSTSPILFWLFHI